MKEDIFLKQMQILNRHLASSKKNLTGLLHEENPSVILKDGSAHHFNPEELKMIAQILPEEMHKLLRLPIFIELSSGKYGQGCARVAGRAECALVYSLLGKDESDDEMFIYRPELRKARRELKTTTQYMFTVAIDK
jgi:uncharacterized protein (UPF0216 family)